jgi:tetratricopeptide (TPR) repeat protein
VAGAEPSIDPQRRPETFMDSTQDPAPREPSSNGPEPAPDEAASLRERLFEGELLTLPRPEDEQAGFLPEWFKGEVPALVYPPLADRGVAVGDSVNLEINPFHIYYGALRELAETADTGRADELRRLIFAWHEHAVQEVLELAYFHMNRDLETALHHFELIMELDPECYEAVQDAGTCHHALGTTRPEERDDRREQAEEYFRRAIEMRPSSGISWWSLARVVHEADPAEASRLLYEFLREYPQGTHREMVEQALQDGLQREAAMEHQAVFSEAESLLAAGNIDRAIHLLTPLANVYSDSERIWLDLGMAYGRRGDPDEAERCLRRAARLAPTEPFIWLELARAYQKQERWRHAEDAATRGLEHDPENIDLLCLLGRSLLRQGKRQEAQEPVARAAELVPDDPEVQRVKDELTRQ